jgi:hypothetical protein
MTPESGWPEPPPPSLPDGAAVGTPIGGADFELNWPRDLFAHEAAAVLSVPSGDWQGRCEWLPIDAFSGSAPVDLFRAHGQDRPNSYAHLPLVANRRRTSSDC